jgi:L-threonylcarbamoyladenylate synthase
VVAAPTDTVYGLIAVAADAGAVGRIYEIKVRNPAQALPLFVGSVEQADLIGEFSGAARALVAAFWPGALTIVVQRKPSYVTLAAAGGDTIGVRMPDDAFLREAALALGPLTGTSANLAGREECRNPSEVQAQLGDSVDLILPLREEPGLEIASLPSTIVDCTRTGECVVLREGTIPRRRIADLLGTAVRMA